MKTHNLLNRVIKLILLNYIKPMQFSVAKSPYSESLYLSFENYEMKDNFILNIRISDHIINEVNYDVQFLTFKKYSNKQILENIENSIKYF